jgi:hypothetical protein
MTLMRIEIQLNVFAEARWIVIANSPRVAEGLESNDKFKIYTMFKKWRSVQQIIPSRLVSLGTNY